MSLFSFATDAKSEQYCREVVDALVWEFGISPSQALDVLNEVWKGQDFVGKFDMRYHLGEPQRWVKRWKERSGTKGHQILRRFIHNFGER